MPIVEFATPDGRRLLVNARNEATSILVDDRFALNYDREGRMTGAWIEGRNYRRSLDNRVIEKQEGPQPGLSYRVRRELEPTEARLFLTDMYTRLLEYRTVLRDPATRVSNKASPTDRETVITALDHVLRCDLQRLEKDRTAYHQIYRPISILPPDQYLALVLQATEGCSYNQCAFCGFYRDRRFHIKSLNEFQQHISAVRAFFGAAINLRKTIFLADANALVIPQDELIPIFDLINAEFALQPRELDYSELKVWKAEHPISFEGIFSFVDAFTTRRKSAQEIAELAVRGLHRVYIGLESGDPALLKFLGKPNTPDDVLHLVRELKAGGVAVGIVILAGIGGVQFAESHIQNTAAVVNAMPLDSGDLIYFSELVDYPGSEYSALAKQANLRPLTIEEIEQQMLDLREAFVFLNKERTPKISYYDIREFIY